MPARPLARISLALLTVGVVLGLTACLPDDAVPPSGSVSPSAGPSVSASPETTPSATPVSPSASPDPSSSSPADAIALPGACDELYSAAMRDRLEAENPPLNDPGVSLLSTNVEAIYDVLASGVPTLRCSWGVPSEIGLVSNVSLIDQAQWSQIEGAATANGMTCGDELEGRLCRIVTEYPENEFSSGYTAGETHYFRGNGWVATAWINYAPEGYTEDIVSQLWG